MVKSVADSERYCIFLVMITKMYSDSHYVPHKHHKAPTVPLKRNVALARTSRFARDWIIAD